MFISICFFRLQKFYCMFLLTIISGPLSWPSSPFSISIIFRFFFSIGSKLPECFRSWIFRVWVFLDKCINFFYHIFYSWDSLFPLLYSVAFEVPVQVSNFFHFLISLSMDFLYWFLFQLSGLELFYPYPSTVCVFIGFTKGFINLLLMGLNQIHKGYFKVLVLCFSFVAIFSAYDGSISGL